MKKYIHITIVAITATTLFMLSGCLVPEDYEANVQMNNDRSYTFTYDGNLIFVLALYAALKEELDKEDDSNEHTKNFGYRFNLFRDIIYYFWWIQSNRDI